MKTEISFTKAKYSKRLLAFALDFLLTAFISLALMLLTQTIYYSSSSYKENSSTMIAIEEESGLFIKDGEELVLITNTSKPTSDEEYRQINHTYSSLLTSFFDNSFFFPPTSEVKGSEIYYALKKQNIDLSNPNSIFIYSDSNQTTIVENPSASQKDLFTFYSKTISFDAMSFIMDNTSYREAVRKINLAYVFLVICIPITIGLIIVFYLFPLLFNHGRQTIGKLTFKIGVVDSRGLSPTTSKFSLRFLIFLFLEIFLSVPSFTLPLILSFSMLAFSKRGQAFHDYLVNTYVVDVSNERIYRTLDEYKSIQEEKTNLDIKPEDVVFHR